jgi:hypothetical protein
VNEVFARTARFLIAALLGSFATAISVVPIKAVPIARGLPAIAVMLEEASPQKVEPIFFAQSLSSCGSPTASMTLLKLTLLTIGADDTFDLPNQPGSTNEE